MGHLSSPADLHSFWVWSRDSSCLSFTQQTPFSAFGFRSSAIATQLTETGRPSLPPHPQHLPTHVDEYLGSVQPFAVSMPVMTCVCHFWLIPRGGIARLKGTSRFDSPDLENGVPHKPMFVQNVTSSVINPCSLRVISRRFFFPPFYRCWGLKPEPRVWQELLHTELPQPNEWVQLSLGLTCVHGGDSGVRTLFSRLGILSYEVPVHVLCLFFSFPFICRCCLHMRDIIPV